MLFACTVSTRGDSAYEYLQCMFDQEISEKGVWCGVGCVLIPIRFCSVLVNTEV